MTRDEWINYIMETYSADVDRPWVRTPENIVVRHPGNRKWIALFMTIPRRYLGLDGDEPIDVINCKCDPMMVGMLRREPGFYPAYHMNKTHWITAALDGSAQEERIRMLIEMSYEATAVMGTDKGYIRE